ncbi:TonB-dependent receptor domain-containing protein [Pseudomonas sp. LRF_L74]|uniref:TonB-dependent receptor domain-containing protein n=1 Tax=Pseudomonas sp. LRF_L74 TaxID=3369422 RepID=UPI003F622FE8
MRIAKPFQHQLLALSIAAGIIAGPAIAAERQVYHIAAGSLDTVLIGISRQSGQVISFEPGIGRLPAPAVEGELSVEEAVRQALVGSGLELQVSPGGAFVVVRKAAAEPSAAAAAVPPGTARWEPLADSPRLDTIIVTGTRRSDTTALDSAAPVQVVTHEQLVSTGATNLNEALMTLVPSFSYPQEMPTSSGNLNVKGATLRGLAPEQALVLVNGKRRTPNAVAKSQSGPLTGTQPVDINTIPLVAIERIEVLQDGASAQYGSDAIAGVINIILREAGDGGSLTAEAGKYFDEGDGLRRRLGGWKGFSLPGDGFLTLSFDGDSGEQTDRSKDDPRRWYFTGDSRESSFDRGQFVTGTPEHDRYSLLANTAFNVSEQLRLYGYLNYAYYKTLGTNSPTTARDDGNVRSIFPDGVQTRNGTENHDLAASFGALLGELYGGQLDLNASYGRSRAQEYWEDELNATLGDDSPVGFVTGTRINAQSNLTADYVRELFAGRAAGPLTLSGGVAYRREDFELRAGDYLGWVDGGVAILDGPNAGDAAPSGRAVSKADEAEYAREVFGAYLGAEGNLTEKLSLGATARVENYSDFGSTWTGRLSGRYQFVASFALRGSLSTSYRAPSLGQIGITSSSSSADSSGNPVYKKIVPAQSAIAQALGFPQLEPEKSKNISLGLVWQPDPFSSLTIDAYQIDIDDRLLLSDDFTGTLVTNLLTASGYSGISSLRVYANAADTRTRGVDIAARRWFDLGSRGRLELSAGGAIVRNEVKKVFSAPGVLAAAGIDINSAYTVDVLEHGYPQDKIILGLNYDLAKWGVRLAAVRYGRTKNVNSDTSQNYWLDPQWVVDAALSYDFSDSLSGTLGAKNLFNSYPDEPPYVVNSINRYSSFSPAGFNGRYLFTSVTYDF